MSGNPLLKKPPMFLRLSVPAFAFLIFSSFNLLAASDTPIPPRIIVSVRDQKLMLLQEGQRAAIYPISTSKFGIGDRRGSMTTPLGWLQVAQKIGDHAPPGAVFHNRRFTGEILQPNAPGRDPIVTRIIWLRGLERSNANAFDRCIYIHGTPQERYIGRPASYGCIRMSSQDVQQVYAQIQIGALVKIIPDSLPKVAKFKGTPSRVIFTANTTTGKSVPAASTANAEPKQKAPAARKRVSLVGRIFGHGA
jgi:lipoprotein-anchoring transpeptidase ErfK/SrfK